MTLETNCTRAKDNFKDAVESFEASVAIDEAEQAGAVHAVLPLLCARYCFHLITQDFTSHCREINIKVMNIMD